MNRIGESFEADIGSGYPSDEKTIQFIKEFLKVTVNILIVLVSRGVLPGESKRKMSKQDLQISSWVDGVTDVAFLVDDTW